jgi:Family of unknown function (DUF6361)
VTSLIAWLDTSSDEQRRVRELIAVFGQSESRDELGIGQIRDAFSDTLFPGTSVIQTRARYFLFVPWIYLNGHRRGLSGARLKAWTDAKERKLIEALRDAGEVSGLIGRRAGPAVKILPSTIYWSGLIRYGILTRDASADHLGAVLGRLAAEADELDSRRLGDWHPTLPAAPSGFPDTVPDGFDLGPDEASWLSERILAAAPGTLLADLVLRREPLDAGSAAPWEDSVCGQAPEEIGATVRHAWLFSLGMHGAALLYNLLIAERYEAAGLTRVADPIEDYRARLDVWNEACRAATGPFRRWDRDGMWHLVGQVNARVSGQTRMFVDTWLDAVVGGSATSAATSDELRRLVAGREQRQKKAQSRLTNERLLRTWTGESGSAQLVYRWGQVRGLVRDLHDGTARDARA